MRSCSGRSRSSKPRMLAQRDVFGDTLVSLCAADPRVVVLDGDLANSTKSDKVAVARPDRFFMLGISEQNLVGVAAGMATLGLVPWVSSFAAFLATRDLDQVRVVVAQPRLNVKLAAHYSGLLTGFTGKTHQVVNDIAIMRTLPNMTVIAPCDGDEARTAIRAVNAFDGPVYLRLTRDPIESVTLAQDDFTIGKARLLREGRDVGIISTGTQTVRAIKGAELLAREGIAAAVLHVPTIKPIDAPAILEFVRSVSCVLTCEEHSVLGGLGGAVCEIVSASEPVRVERMGIEDVDGESGPNDDLLRKYRLMPADIAARARRLLAAA
jgi:transketolase